MRTDELIVELARGVEPVSRLHRPWVRTGAWAAGAFVYLAILVVVVSPRDDLGLRLRDPQFMFEQTAALLTAITAALAAFATVIPGYRREILALPLLFGAIWVTAVAAGALQEAGLLGRGGAAFQTDWRCFAAILGGAAVPGLTMAIMIRRGAPLTPRTTAALAALAAAGLGNLGVCVFHPHSSNVTVLFWHCGTVLLIAAVAGAAGRGLLGRVSQARVPARG